MAKLFLIILKKSVDKRNKSCILLVDVSNDANAKRTEDKMESIVNEYQIPETDPLKAVAYYIIAKDENGEIFFQTKSKQANHWGEKMELTKSQARAMIIALQAQLDD